MHVRRIIGGVLLLLIAPSAVRAQAPASSAASSAATRGFNVGENEFGPVIGLGGLGGASLAFGVRYEHAIKELPDLGGGILGFSLDANYYSYTTGFGSGNVGFHYLPIGAAANYHFKLTERKWDPFLGLGLGYSIESLSGGGSTYTANSGLYFIGRAGLRYFSSERMAWQVDVGAGAATLNVGLIFKL